MAHPTVLNAYFTAWSSHDTASVLAALSACWTPHSRYTDPITPEVTGPEALAAVIVQFHQRFAGASLEPVSGLDAHGHFGRFAWRLRLPQPVVVDGQAYARETDGFDFIEFTPDGQRIARIVGFFGPLPRP